MSSKPGRLQITELSRTIGAELRGVDLKQPLDADMVQEIKAAFNKYKVIFFPQQHLNPAQHVQFARNFGKLMPAHPILPGIDGHPEVYEVNYTKMNEREFKNVAKIDRTEGIGWHSDLSFLEQPPLGTILNMVHAPPTGGDTMWSDGYAAYEALSPAFQQFLGSLTAVHDGTSVFQWLREVRADAGGEWAKKDYGEMMHPLVRTIPQTGGKVLFLNTGQMTKLKPLSNNEGMALIHLLAGHSTQVQFTVRYHWRSGDLCFWDNRATQHSVVGDYGEQHRLVQRITIEGERPI